MSNLSVSLTPELEKFLESEIESGEFESKGQIVRKALRKFEEELVISRILQASREVEKGNYYEGDLDEIVKKMK